MGNPSSRNRLAGDWLERLLRDAGQVGILAGLRNEIAKFRAYLPLDAGNGGSGVSRPQLEAVAARTGGGLLHAAFPECRWGERITVGFNRHKNGCLQNHFHPGWSSRG